MTKYTAADFANARFAKHEDGDFASRLYPEDADPWFGTEERTYTDQRMAGDGGWVPVPTKPTITHSEYKFYENESGEGNMSVAGLLKRLGIEIIPDPEPTNTELISDALIDGFEKEEFTLESSFRDIAAALTARGVTPPTKN